MASFTTHPPILGLPEYSPTRPEPRFFTAVWTGNYLISDYREGAGSHPGVDIDCTKYPRGHTSVHAVMDGVVVTARKLTSGPGWHIALRHDGVPDPANLRARTTLYSCYEHLSSFTVRPGVSVRAGDQVGVSGSTGNSTGPHLHFQIDRASAPSHPYWPWSMGEIRRLRMDFWTAVNRGYGIEKVRQHTVSPLAYLQRFYEASSYPFPDVDPATPHFAAISWLRTKNVVRGYADGFFLAEQPVTRAEFLKICFETLGVHGRPSPAGPFPDVPLGHWAAPYVTEAVMRGIVGGEADRRTGANVFRPERTVTRAEAFKILLLAAGITLRVDSSLPRDVPAGAWFAPFAAEAVRAGLLDFDGGRFDATRVVTRGDAAEMLYRLLGR